VRWFSTARSSFYSSHTNPIERLHGENDQTILVPTYASGLFFCAIITGLSSGAFQA
jgi:hypothetical protein